MNIRRATEDDLDALARFGHALASVHLGFDAQRFWMPGDGVGTFAEYFRGELVRPDVVLLIAEIDSRPVGYAFVRMEGESLEDLRAAGAWLHDLYLDPDARGSGVGRALVRAAVDAARELGSDSLTLAVSPHNLTARRLFEESGLRDTMIEMRIDLGSD